MNAQSRRDLLKFIGVGCGIAVADRQKLMSAEEAPNPRKISLANDPTNCTGLSLVLTAQGYKRINLIRGKETGWYYVSCIVQDKPAHLVVDTGASRNTLVSQWVHEEIPEVIGRKRNAEGKGTVPAINFVNGNRTFYPSFCLDSVASPCLATTYHPRDLAIDVKQDGLKSVQGLLGEPFLRYFSAIIDYGSDSLFLLDPIRIEHRLQGIWQGVLVEINGIKNTFPKDKKCNLTFKGVKGFYDSSDFSFDFTTILNLSSNPRQMDWFNGTGNSGKGELLKVIYKLNENLLTIAGDLLETGKDSPDRPKNFSTVKGDAHVVVTFKQVESNNKID